MRFPVLFLLAFSFAATAGEPIEALAEVNRQRAAKGLPAYQYDAGLTQAAAACATYRAEHRIHGHSGIPRTGDFTFLPAGVHADAAGCAAWKDGFGACALFETQYHTAGAAFVVGADNLRYCQLFVRKGPPTSVVASDAKVAAVSKPDTPTGKIDTDLSALDARMTAAEHWGQPHGLHPVAATKPVTVANLDQRIARMEQFGAVGGFRPSVKPDKVANAENVEKRLRDAERFAAGLGYVPPVVKALKTAVPEDSTAKPVASTAVTTGSTAGDLAICVQRDASGKVIREWTEPAELVRKAHGITATTPASQCASCQSGQCAVPAKKTATIQGGCPNGQCPNVSR